MSRLLIKKNRIGEVSLPHPTTEVAGIYLEPGRGIFYALVPERERDEGGTLYQSDRLEALRTMVENALAERHALVFRRVIRVFYPKDPQQTGVGISACRGVTSWSREAALQGSDVIGPLGFIVLDVAPVGSPEGPRLQTIACVPRPSGEGGGWYPREEKAKGVMLHRPESAVDLDYSPAVEAGIRAFQARIRATDLKIRAFLSAAVTDPALFTVGLPLLEDPGEGSGGAPALEGER
jgi:hypothetical protein